MWPHTDWPTVIRRLPARGRVYLTFDDGPDPTWTPRFLDLLAAADTQATFFVIGHEAQRWAPLLRRIRKAGHAVGNHTYSHRHPWTMSATRARREVRDGAEVIAQVLGERPSRFRPPHGRLRPAMVDEAQDGGQRIVLWSLSAIDWGPLGRAEQIGVRLDRVEAGDIVLMHDGRHRHNRPDETARVLPAFLARLRNRGLVPSVLPSAEGAANSRRGGVTNCAPSGEDSV